MVLEGRVFVAIGANLPATNGSPVLQTCEAAVRALAELPGVRLLVRSRWFSSAPVPASDQPRYLNGVVRFASEATPEALLAALQAIEAKAGRVRSVSDAARPLDLDLIDLEGQVRATDPVLPHPRAHLRAFVLLPLRDVAPDWRHPVTGRTVHQLLAALPPEDTHPL